MFILLSSLGALVLIVFASLFIISGVFEKPKYLEPWDKTYEQKFDDPRIRLVACGLLAANGHNMQPWKVKLDKRNPMAFYLYADSDRITDKVDPDSRQMMITQGTFLEYVKIAGEETGYQTAIKLFPEGLYNEKSLVESMKNKPVAKVTLTKEKPQSNPLYASIFLPDTNRSAYQPTKLTTGQINQLEHINGDAKLSVEIYQDKKNMDKLSDYAIKAAVIEAGVNRVMKESEIIFRANEYQKNKYRYGFSVDGQGTTGIMLGIKQGLVTLFPSLNKGKAASDLFIQSTRASVDSTPAYALIISKDNSRSSQVKSGMLYSKLILTAQKLGIVMQPLSQSLEEYPEMKDPYNHIHHDYAPGGGTIQMLVRLGKPIKKASQSMRRDVMDLIISE
ncbi:Acg family FMN-binding oxidoreductase [Cytobacillus sp. Hz8]|uniref:Acg family FMN-binding oxidoreductase n=1 Tax=Cytobacillus sp. Hz8 TaxID=3347168 RepID=UPI0035DA96CB